MKTEWRPDGWLGADEHCSEWENPCDDGCNSCCSAYESGASAMLAAVLVYLDEPCDKHPEKELVELPFKDEWMEFYPEHRKDCPQCMNELRGEK